LLDDNATEFGLLINQFLLDKTSEVQKNTSKKVIKQFVKNIKFVDVEV